MANSTFVLREYLYLDTARLQNYVSSLGLGLIEEIRETETAASGREGGGGINASLLTIGGKARTEQATTRELTMRITAQYLFDRVYQELEARAGAITRFDEGDPIDISRLRRGDIVEVTRSFALSPLNEMVRQVFGLVRMMEDLGLMEESIDQATRTAIQQMTLIFRRDDASQDLPLVAEGQGTDASVVFVARTEFLNIPEEEFVGEMTVFGRVERVIPSGNSLDLFELLRILPSGFGRGANVRDIREAILKLFESWPAELGGPLDRRRVTIAGPAIRIVPVAVY